MRRVGSLVWQDDALALDRARLDEPDDLWLHPDTFARLSRLHCLEAVWEYLIAVGEGEHTIPADLVHPTFPADSDLAHVLSASEPGHGSACTIPGCLQDDLAWQLTEFGGFWLCATHRLMVDGWDAVVALARPG